MHGPFDGKLVDGFLWGCGALDMKGQSVEELVAMLLLKWSGVRLNRDVIFASIADEEEGGEGRSGAGRDVDGLETPLISSARARFGA